MLNKMIKTGIFLSLAFIGVSASISKNVSLNNQRQDNTKSVSQIKSTSNGKNIIWENPDPAGLGPVNWNGVYRFGLDGTDGNKECIATFPQETWDKIKYGTFYINLAGSDWIDMRVTTGWWSTTWTGNDITTGDERLILNEDGTYTLEINFTGDPIQELLDQQHLLFTGGGYTPLSLYTEGGPEPPAEEVVWENDGSLPTISWSNEYRFSNVEHSSGEECYAFPMDIWERLKTETFYIDVDSKDNIRVTTGWWSVDWPSKEYNNADDLVYNEEKKVWTLEINFAGHDILNSIDDQHLLFTGQGYKVLRIYFKGEEPEPEPYRVLWDNDHTFKDPSWGGGYRFGFAGGPFIDNCVALFSQDDWDNVIKGGTFYIDIEDYDNDNYFQIHITDGNWEKIWGDFLPSSSPLLIKNNDGTWTLEITLGSGEFIDAIESNNLLITGGGYTLTRLYCGTKDEPVKQKIWTNPYPNWMEDKSVYYRFAPEFNIGTEAIHVFSTDTWEKMKKQHFYLDFEAKEGFNIRVTTGWWDKTWTGDLIYPSSEYLTENGDGTWTLDIFFENDPIVDFLDDHHLLFEGEKYRPLALRLDDGSDNISATSYVNVLKRVSTSFKNKAYIYTTNDIAEKGNEITLEVGFEDGVDKFPYELEVTYNDGLRTCELTQVDEDVYSFNMPNFDVDIALRCDTDYVVQFDWQGHGIQPEPQTLHEGDKITEPKWQTFDQNLVFLGWYQENSCTTIPWDFKNDVIENDMVLFARWEIFVSAQLKSAPTKTEYLCGEDLDLSGAKITVHSKQQYSETDFETDIDIIPEMVSGYDKYKPGVQVLTVTYGDLTDTFAVNVTDYISSIAMKSNPTKVEYKFGENLNLAGAKITVNMASGASTDIDVTSDMVSGYDKNKSGEQVITITYQGYTTTFVVTVLPAPIPVEVRLDIILPASCALVLVLLILLTVHFVNKKKNLDLLNSLLPNNLECIKVNSVDDRFDEYVFKYSYKDRQMSYYMYKLKTLRFSNADAKKEFIELINNGKLRRYSNKYYRQIKRLGC